MNAMRSLKDAGFDADDIGVMTREDRHGKVIARDLDREYADPRGDTFTGDRYVYNQLPDTFVDAIRRSNLSDDAVDWYRARINDGLILVTVRTGDRMDDAVRIVHEHDGWVYGEEHHRMKETRRPEAMRATEGEVRVPVMDEEVFVEKREHQVGEVRVSAETTRETREFPTTLTHEEIRVERRKLDRPVSPDEYKGMTAAQGADMRMPIVEEEIRVTKRPVIREELVVTRMPVTERQTIRETVTHVEPRVETTGEVEMEGLTKEERERRRKMPPAA